MRRGNATRAGGPAICLVGFRMVEKKNLKLFN